MIIIIIVYYESYLFRLNISIRICHFRLLILYVEIIK